MKQRKIAIIRKDTGLFGGIERQILMLSKGLKKDGFIVYFITNNSQSRLAESLSKINVIVKEFDLSKLVKTGKDIGIFLKKEDIRIVQSHMLKESFIIRIAKIFNWKIKHIFRVHTYIDCSQISRVKKNFYHFISKLTDFLVDKYVSINEFNVNELTTRTRVRISKISVLHDVISCVDITATPIKQPIKKIGMIANFVPFKGHDILVRGLKLLKDEGVYLEAVIIGGESYSKGNNQTPIITNEIIKLCQELEIEKQIELAGFVNNIHEVIKDIPIIVLPSYSEGTPNCLLEAMSLKRIVIASNVGGIPEFIEDGVNGFLHESKSAEAFAIKIKKVLELDELTLNRVSENGFNTWNKDYSEDKVSKKYVEFINSLV